MTRHLLVIGAQRSGTTYLQTLLDAHPQITMARPSRPEPKVFLSAEQASRGAEWYRAVYFSHATTELVLGEKSTSYIEEPMAAVRARDVLGDPDIVVCLRDPVDRAVSNWRFSTDNGLETRPLDVALRENLEAPKGWDDTATSVSPFAYLERGRYAHYLEAWWSTFPSRVHVVFLSELVADDAVVGDLYARLRVDPDYRPPGQDRPVNQSDEPAPDLPPEQRAQLEEYFGPSDAALSRHLGRSLPWGPTSTRSST